MIRKKWVARLLSSIMIASCCVPTNVMRLYAAEVDTTDTMMQMDEQETEEQDAESVNTFNETLPEDATKDDTAIQVEDTSGTGEESEEPSSIFSTVSESAIEEVNPAEIELGEEVFEEVDKSGEEDFEGVEKSGGNSTEDNQLEDSNSVTSDVNSDADVNADVSEEEPDEERATKDAVMAVGDSFETAAAINIGTGKTITISESQTYYFKFTPNAEGMYQFYSTSEDEDMDVDAELFDSADSVFDYIDEDSDSGEGYNFQIRHVLERGKTYYIGVNSYVNGKVSIHVDKLSFYADADTSTLQTDVGEPVTLEVEAVSDNPLTYTWYDQDENVIQGANSSSYTFTPNEIGEIFISCQVSDRINTEQFDFVIEATDYLRISAVEDYYCVEPGSEITLDTDIEAYNKTGLTYEWRFKDQKIQGAKGSTLKIVANEQGEYTCTVTNASGLEDTASFEIRLMRNYVAYPEGAGLKADGTRATEVRINMARPERTELKVIIEGANANGFKYKWWKSVEHPYWGWPNEDEKELGNGGRTYTVSSPQTGYYKCDIIDEYGNTKSVLFFVNIENNLRVYPEGASTTNGSKNRYVYIDAKKKGKYTLKVNVSANDTSKLSYKWYSGTYDESGAWPEDGQTKPQMTINLDGDGGKFYKCVVQDQYGNYDVAFFEIIRNNLTLSSANGEVEHWYDNGSELLVVKKENEDLTLRTIAKADDTSSLQYEWSYRSGAEDGSAEIEPEISSNTDTLVLKENIPGIYTCVVTDQYYNYKFIEYQVLISDTDKVSIEQDKVTVLLNQESIAYTGQTVKPMVTLRCGTSKLVEGRDYEVTCTDTELGTAKAIIKGKGLFTGTVTKTFKIVKARQALYCKTINVVAGKTATATISGRKTNVKCKTANNAIASITSNATNTKLGKLAIKGLKVGTTKVSVEAEGTENYEGASISFTVNVIPAATSRLTAENLVKGIKIKWAKVPGANGYVIYRNNKKIKTITSGNTLTYSDVSANTNGSKYVYKVVAKATSGTSTLSKSLTAYRVARPAITSLKNSASKKMTVKWKKNAKANGYQIQYSLKSNFRGAKTTSVSKNSIVSKVIGNLTKGKTYFVRFRTYKKAGGKNYYSAWSAAKRVKISK